MPAERPQGIGPLYVSYPQFASQNCNFSIHQWKSPPSSSPSRCSTRPLGRAVLTLLCELGALTSVLGDCPDPDRVSNLFPRFSAPALRPQRLCVKSSLSSSSKTKTAQSKLCRFAEPRYLIAAICYPLPSKTPLPKNPPPPPPTPIPTPSPSALHAPAKSG